MDYNQKMHERLDKREKQIKAWFGKLRRQIDKGRLGGEPARLWLDKFAVGNGLNIACGDFPIGESFGVDMDYKKIGIDFWAFGDGLLADQGPLDFIVTNYLECFPNTQKVLQDWRAIIKPGGVLAIVCCNSPSYENPKGPLANLKRVNCFTLETLSFHLNRAGFKVFEYEIADKELRVASH